MNLIKIIIVFLFGYYWVSFYGICFCWVFIIEVNLFNSFFLDYLGLKV